METTVKLTSKSLGVTQEFSVAHAERLLRIRQSGWELDDDRFIFDAQHGIKRRRHKEKDNGGQEA